MSAAAPRGLPSSGRSMPRSVISESRHSPFGHRRNPAVLIPQSCKAKGQAMRKNTICLWYDKDAEAAARFYAATFPDSAVSAVFHAPTDYPSGKKGDVLTVNFTVLGIPCLGLNGGPMFQPKQGFSVPSATDDPAGEGRYLDPN